MIDAQWSNRGDPIIDSSVAVLKVRAALNFEILTPSVVSQKYLP